MELFIDEELALVAKFMIVDSINEVEELGWDWDESVSSRLFSFLVITS